MNSGSMNYRAICTFKLKFLSGLDKVRVGGNFEKCEISMPNNAYASPRFTVKLKFRRRRHKAV